jgi:hypothetical protein
MTPLREIIEALEDLLILTVDINLENNLVSEVEEFYGKLRDLEDETNDGSFDEFGV